MSDTIGDDVTEQPSGHPVTEPAAPTCEHEWKHLHDTAYGMESTHMEGSERFECPKCNRVVHQPDADLPSLVFVLDHTGAR